MRSRAVKGRQLKARTDTRTRAVVDKAIELQAVVGTQVAAGLMANRNVPFEVAKRVLKEPSKKRRRV